MPKEINGNLYYVSQEVCARVGICRSTLYRWLDNGVLKTKIKDRRGWRLFREADIAELLAVRNRE